MRRRFRTARPRLEQTEDAKHQLRRAFDTVKAQARGQKLGAHTWQNHGDTAPTQSLNGARGIDLGPGGHEGRYRTSGCHLRQVEQEVRRAWRGGHGLPQRARRAG